VDRSAVWAEQSGACRAERCVPSNGWGRGGGGLPTDSSSEKMMAATVSPRLAMPPPSCQFLYTTARFTSLNLGVRHSASG
jgi:hypothetical protein